MVRQALDYSSRGYCISGNSVLNQPFLYSTTLQPHCIDTKQVTKQNQVMRKNINK